MFCHGTGVPKSASQEGQQLLMELTLCSVLAFLQHLRKISLDPFGPGVLSHVNSILPLLLFLWYTCHQVLDTTREGNSLMRPQRDNTWPVEQMALSIFVRPPQRLSSAPQGSYAGEDTQKLLSDIILESLLPVTPENKTVTKDYRRFLAYPFGNCLFIHNTHS